MPEGVSENLNPKKSEFIRKVGDLIKGLDPRERRKKYISSHINVAPEPRVKITPKVKVVPKINVLPVEDSFPSVPEREWSTLPDVGRNMEASKKFLTTLRDQAAYKRDPEDPRFWKSNLGYRVQDSVSEGWFMASDFMHNSQDRYQLPLAMFIAGNHARLVVKGAYQTPEGKKIMVWDPMRKGFEELSTNESFAGVVANGLIGSKLVRGEYDIAKFFENPELAKYRGLLIEAKAFNFQTDFKNCIPYCLFANAMIYGLEPGDTEFKRQGIKQFEQDFGVRIITREEMLHKPRIRIVE